MLRVLRHDFSLLAFSSCGSGGSQPAPSTAKRRITTHVTHVAKTKVWDFTLAFHNTRILSRLFRSQPAFKFKNGSVASPSIECAWICTPSVRSVQRIDEYGSIRSTTSGRKSGDGVARSFRRVLVRRWYRVVP